MCVCVCVCVCVRACVNKRSAMGELMSKLHEHKNNTDIPLYQIYLSKLQEIILKSYRLNFFQRNRHWLLPQSPDDFGISCEPFQRTFL